jgi:hypothetical protein
MGTTMKKSRSWRVMIDDEDDMDFDFFFFKSFGLSLHVLTCKCVIFIGFSDLGRGNSFSEFV